MGLLAFMCNGKIALCISFTLRSATSPLGSIAQIRKDRANRLKEEMVAGGLNESGAVPEVAGSAVQLDGVRVSYLFDKGSYTAVEHIDLSVADGEFLSIVGPTGCGKSTLLNIWRISRLRSRARLSHSTGRRRGDGTGNC